MRATIIALLLATAGCAVDTNAPDCATAQEVSGFALYVQENPGLKDADYTWTVTTDGVTRTRTVTVKNGVGKCDCATISNPADPAPGADVEALPEISIRMDALGAQLAITDDPAAPGMTLPSHIAVAITRAGQQIATFTFDPTYDQAQGACQGVVRSTFFANVVGP